MGVLFKRFYFDADYLYSNSCKDPKGWALIDKTGKTIEINYTYDDGPNISKYFKEKFIGKKIY